MGKVDDESTPMPIAELLHNARFLTNNLGVQTDVVIPIDTWQTLLNLVQRIEPLEDNHWGQQAEQALNSSTTVGSELFMQEIERLAAFDS
jgi:hypothetical protein